MFVRVSTALAGFKNIQIGNGQINPENLGVAAGTIRTHGHIPTLYTTHSHTYFKLLFTIYTCSYMFDICLWRVCFDFTWIPMEEGNFLLYFTLDWSEKWSLKDLKVQNNFNRTQYASVSFVFFFFLTLDCIFTCCFILSFYFLFFLRFLLRFFSLILSSFITFFLSVAAPVWLTVLLAASSKHWKVETVRTKPWVTCWSSSNQNSKASRQRGGGISTFQYKLSWT